MQLPILFGNSLLLIFLKICFYEYNRRITMLYNAKF